MIKEKSMIKSKNNEFLLKVVERYLFHRNYYTDNPFVAEMAKKMCDIELSEIWMLTQL